jgi:hypothetical protein
MTIKQSAESVIRNAFVGKKFIGSQLKKTEEFLCNIYNEDTDVKVADITGKIIKEVVISDCGYRDCGISVKFDEFDDWFFFLEDDQITVEE